MQVPKTGLDGPQKDTVGFRHVRRLNLLVTSSWMGRPGPVCQNWVDHFAPKSLDQLVGNASIVRPGFLASLHGSLQPSAPAGS